MMGPSKLWLRALLTGTALAVLGGTASFGQSAQDVTVDLSAIDGTPAPVAPGRVILRPPPGMGAVSSGSIKLKPPSAKKAPAPAPAATPVAAAAAPAAPTPTPTPVPAPAKAPVTAAAAPAPAPAAPAPVAAAKPATPPPAKAPTPAAAAAAASPAPAAPVPDAVAATSAPSAAVKRAQQEPAGPVAAPLPDAQQNAAVPPAASKTATVGPTAEEMTAALTVPFAPGVANIDVSGQGVVRDLAGRMSGDKSLRVQLMAYASDPDKNTSKARRLALDRAISIRNMLIEAGVERTRIEVRALGDQGEGGNLDRVDAVAVKR